MVLVRTVCSHTTTYAYYNDNAIHPSVITGTKLYSTVPVYRDCGLDDTDEVLSAVYCVPAPAWSVDCSSLTHTVTRTSHDFVGPLTTCDVNIGHRESTGRNNMAASPASDMASVRQLETLLSK